jgi:ribonucleotide monophosphatase NagD (HAD superfamily)
MRADGLSLDVGPFVAAIEFATGREAYVVGKPARG